MFRRDSSMKPKDYCLIANHMSTHQRVDANDHSASSEAMCGQHDKLVCNFWFYSFKLNL